MASASKGSGKDEIMDSAKRKRLERTGWVVGDTSECLQLTEEEGRFLELKLAIASESFGNEGA